MACQKIATTANWGVGACERRLGMTPALRPPLSLPGLPAYRLQAQQKEKGVKKKKILVIGCFFPLLDKPPPCGFWSHGWACFPFVGLIAFDWATIPHSWISRNIL